MISAVLRDLNKDVIGESSKNVYLHVAQLTPHCWFWFVQNREMKLHRHGKTRTRPEALAAALDAVERVRECRRRLRPPEQKPVPVFRKTPEIKLLIPKGARRMRRTRRTKGTCQCEFHRHPVVHICTKCKVIYHHDDGSHFGHGGIETYDAVMYAHDDEVQQLRARVAPYMAAVEGFSGDTPLHHAAGNGNLALIRSLLDHVDINTKDNKGQTPMDWAVQRGRTEIAAFLEKKGGKRGQRRALPPPSAVGVDRKPRRTK